MISFESDYICGAHPAVLEALAKTNLEPVPGYGADRFCAQAAEKILDACGLASGEVHFLVGGTQTNQVVISTMLRDFEGVVAARTGHVAVHEAGAIEYSGHKVLELPSRDGKMDAADLRDYAETFYGDGNHEHMVFPGMVYISFPTEYGTLYSKAELTALHDVCREFKMPLFIDGARLGYGLASPECDLTLPGLASLCEVFYIGGTKVGAFCGEAVVFTDKAYAPAHFDNVIKKRGALLAKGRVLGVQFDALFTDGLYYEIGREAIRLADRLRAALREKGYRLAVPSPTNQVFAWVDAAALVRLHERVAFNVWEAAEDGGAMVRFVVGCSTPAKDVEALIALL